MYARRNANTSQYEIVIDIDEITEAAQSKAGLSEFFVSLAKFYLKITAVMDANQIKGYDDDCINN